MNVAATLSKLAPTLVPSLDGDRNVIRDLWDRLEPLPGGKAVFSRAIGMMAPYSGTIGARVLELAPGMARVEMRDRRAVRNHLRSIHAIALCNLAEIAGNVALAYTLPDDARFIVAGLSIDYVKKARGTIVGVGECPAAITSARREIEVVVSLRDRGDDEVARAVLRSLVGPKKRDG